MPKLKADIYAWIPQADVPNPLAVPNEAIRKAIGPGASGARFGGDNFQYPPKLPTGWSGLTYRAMQSVEIAFDKFGDQPVVMSDSGVQTGLTTVLDKPRSQGGVVVHSMRASVMKSPKATAVWSDTDKWYQLSFEGAAQDPVPAAAAQQLVGDLSGKLAAMVVPNLSWDVSLRVQQGEELPTSTKLRYAFSSAISLDSASQISDSATAPKTGNLLHGTIEVTQFPSYVLYLTVQDGSSNPTTQIAYFSDASARWAPLVRIVLAQTDVLRPLYW